MKRCWLFHDWQETSSPEWPGDRYPQNRVCLRCGLIDNRRDRILAEMANRRREAGKILEAEERRQWEIKKQALLDDGWVMTDPEKITCTIFSNGATGSVVAETDGHIIQWPDGAVTAFGEGLMLMKR